MATIKTADTNSACLRFSGRYHADGVNLRSKAIPFVTRQSYHTGTCLMGDRTSKGGYERVFIYLSGSIEFAAGFGRAWRAELTPFLCGIGHEVYDPAAD